ncbi:GNAT family N-acetyltransferase [Microbacterium gorillae]|uniref:GNAT family N-acetyltransferase n=1 Tax=Microbacterium gorillae TaxID=1231063 RepID=UPI00069464D5|nr:GNAT family protein [Microbacterium gorillae]
MADTERVTLRTRTDADADVLYRIASDLDDWEQRSPRPPAPLTREAYLARLAAGAEGPDAPVQFVVDLDGDAVGSVSLFDIDLLARHAEVGIALSPAARGRGIGTAALRQLIEFAFVRDNLRRVHLQVLASNAAAIRSYEKCGFVTEGRRREHAWVRGSYEDIIVMGLLRADWDSSRP